MWSLVVIWRWYELSNVKCKFCDNVNFKLLGWLLNVFKMFSKMIFFSWNDLYISLFLNIIKTPIVCENCHQFRWLKGRKWKIFKYNLGDFKGLTICLLWCIYIVCKFPRWKVTYVWVRFGFSPGAHNDILK